MYPQYPLASSIFDFYKTEILIVLANIALIILYLRLPAGTTDILFIFISFFSIIGFCIEHSYSIIFDKELNSITTITKALFVNKYRISRKYDLDRFSGATVSMHAGSKNGPTYSTDLVDKNGMIVRLTGYSSSNYNHYAGIAQQINTFFESERKCMKLDEHPYTFRLVSIILVIIGQGSMLTQVLTAH